MVRNPLIRKPATKLRMAKENKSAGILEDHVIRKNIATKEGTITKTPVDDIDIANKKYVDDNAGGAPEGTAVLSTGEVGGTKFLREDGDGTSSWQAAAGGGDVTKVGVPANDQVGIWTGDGTIEGSANLTFDGNDLAVGTNITLGGTVDGIDVATDVAANTTHRGVTTGNPHVVLLDEVGNPSATATFTMANKSIIYNFVATVGNGAMELNVSGAFAGDVLHVHQHTGNVGATNGIHIEGDDADFCPLRIEGVGTFDIVAGAISVGNITTSGTVDGIDIATDVAANTLKDTNVSTNLSMGTVDGTQYNINSSDGTNVALPLADTNNWGIISDEIFDEIAVNTTHAADNTQAHSDYLLNSGVDEGVGLTLTGDNSSADTAYVPMVLYNTDGTPPAASGFPIGTLYVQYTA